MLSGSNDFASGSGPPYTFAPPPILVVFGHASASVLVEQAIVFTGPDAYATVDVFGAPTVRLSELAIGATATVNVCAYSQMRGDVTELGSYESVDIRGSADTSTFANHASRIDNYGSLAIDVNVVGTGTFDMGFETRVGFSAGVSAGQTINQTGGLLTIEDTADFHATVNLSDGPDAGTIYLKFLDADAYTFHNDLLSLTSKGKDVFDLKLNAPGVGLTFDVNYGPHGEVLPSGVLIGAVPSAAVAQVTLLNHV